MGNSPDPCGYATKCRGTQPVEPELADQRVSGKTDLGRQTAYRRCSVSSCLSVRSEQTMEYTGIVSK